MDKVISPNMLHVFEKCPKKFYFRYIKNLSMPIDDTHFETGKNVHALAAYYLKNENIDKFEKELSPKELSMWHYLKNNKYFGFECIGAEYTLYVKIGDYYYGGRLDALVKNDNNYYILDYKTGAIPASPQNDYQTIIYMLTVSEYFKTDKITFVYIDLQNKKEIEIIFNNNLKQEYKTKLIVTTEKLIKNDFSAYKKDDKCNCEYKIICY